MWVNELHQVTKEVTREVLWLKLFEWIKQLRNII